MQKQFGLKALRGLLLNIFLCLCGCLSLYYKDDLNDRESIANVYQPGAKLVLTIQEPLLKKPGSYKTLASVRGIILNNKLYKTNGSILLFFEKDPVHLKLKYGDILISGAVLQPVSNTGNPAAFDYRRYCYLQGIHYQLFLNANSFTLTGKTNVNLLKKFLFDLRNEIIAIMQQNIPGKKESGLAEALLIGYKDNLDKELVQSYSNTGVVHVIAISGLHLGLIYALLVRLTRRLNRSVTGRWIQLLIVITGIWIFSLLAGGSASVVRSAVMFTCIATGYVLSRKSSVYNSLAASAFLLLNYNPFWLWDTGFQLSYAAVLSIVLFQKPVYNLITVENKLLDMLWRTCAVTLSAQVLTTPVSVFYFHQFPILFLATNLIAIPLSSAILIAEIFLCCISLLSPAAVILGKIIYFLIYGMNSFVEFIDRLPHSNWRHLQIDVLQFFLLYTIIAGKVLWLSEKIKTGLAITLAASLFFLLIRSLSFYQAGIQQKIIVYNIPKNSAVEFVKGRKAMFIAGAAVKDNVSLIRFHIEPSRIYHRISTVYASTDVENSNFAYWHNGKKILVIHNPVKLGVNTDLVVIGGNPGGKITDLITGMMPDLIVFDSSNARWKIRAWTKQCQELGLACFSVPDEGAFVMNLN